MKKIIKKVYDVEIGNNVKDYGKVKNIQSNSRVVLFEFENKKHKTFKKNKEVECLINSIDFEINSELEIEVKCDCGGHIELIYKGEHDENYYYMCECGSELTIDGYQLDCL